MYGNFVLLDESGKLQKGERAYLGDVKGKNEAWLRDTLFDNPDIIPRTTLTPGSDRWCLFVKSFKLTSVGSTLYLSMRMGD